MRLTTTTGILSLGLLLALPAAALADDATGDQAAERSSSSTSSSSARTNDYGQRADDNAVRRTDRGVDDTGGAARGGGPQRNANDTSGAQPAGQDRAAMLHATSPRVITVQTELDAARVTADGIARMAALESGALSASYREHARALGNSIRDDLQVAERHLNDLRSSVQQLNLQDRLGNDLSQVDQLFTRVRTDLGTLESGRGAAEPMAASVRDTARTISREMSQARDAMNRIERGLR